MALRGLGYSRFVRTLKVALPLAAVVLLSTIFLIDQDQIEFDESLLGALPEGMDFDEGVLSPRLAGELSDGTPYALRAEFAVPSLGGYVLRDVSARVDRAGDPVEMTAAEGLYDSAAKEITLSGGVDLSAQSGLQLRTETVQIGLEDRGLTMPEPLNMTGGGIDLRANSLRTEPGLAGDDIIWFEGDVRLIIMREPTVEDME